jgi:GTPase SAR1 family protein
MTIKDIIEIKNEQLPKTISPVKEVMNIKIPDIIDGIPNRNSFIWVLTGSGGSGKTSLLLNFFKRKELYRGKFHNIFYICPMSSFLSVQKHPFSNHDKVYHELTVEVLEGIYNLLCEMKESEEEEQEYNCIIIDDMASSLKENDIQKVLNKMLIKARHLNCAFIFTLQSYYYFPKMLRKQITNITMFKSKNLEEANTIFNELLNMNKEDALKLYNYVFAEPYAHLDIDTVDNNIYKNFNLLSIQEK